MSDDDLIEAASQAIEAAACRLAAEPFGRGFVSMQANPFDPATDKTSVVVRFTPACRCRHRPHGITPCAACECPWSYQPIPPEARPSGYTTVADLQAAQRAAPNDRPEDVA